MKMPWEDDINWNNTATTIVKGEPMSSWYTIQRLSALSRLITAVGVSDIGKERWFEQTGGRWYDRREGDYIDFNTMIDRVESTIKELEEG